jgi:hypothetical protein
MADTKKGMAIKTIGTETVTITSGTNVISTSLGTNVVNVAGGTNVFNVSTGTNVVSISGSVTADVTNTVGITGTVDVTNTVAVAGGTNVFSVSTGTNVVSVSTGTNAVKTNLFNGTNEIFVGTNGQIKAEIVPESVTQINKFATGSVTNTGTLVLSHTVTSGKTFVGHIASFGSFEQGKATLTLEDGTNVTNALAFYGQAGLTVPQNINGISLLGDGTKLLKLTVTNAGETDTFEANIQGYEK